MKISGENSGTPEYVADIYSSHISLIVTTKGLDLELHRVLTTYMIIDLSRNRFEGYLCHDLNRALAVMSIPNHEARNTPICLDLWLRDYQHIEIMVYIVARNTGRYNLPSIIGRHTLNLSHICLEGHILASFHQLSVLESLDLSSNKIGGKIPQQVASLTFLAFLNLSDNHLVGCIPKGKQFDTFENSSYQGNDGLHGLPLSNDCGGDDGVPQATTPVELDDDEEEEEEEEEGDLISW
ncbi:hypothetical protein CQW23_19111 [Capsicum baccatum]|uniref:Uncharacterized protein n=1 Tax=Capsicum baccatum TaxID=33114 RepID=A0A2G2W4V4_CAPBA|nr:hypothetical protein CQW23_19111 [Capsicum baccatum]